MRVIAIDPGAVSGAYAVLDSAGEAVVGDLPVVGGDLNISELIRIVRNAKADAAIVERVGAMPKQGVSSTFKFGAAFGAIKAAVAAAGLPLNLVTPQTWKGHFKLRNAEKDASRVLAVQRFPALAGLHLKKHHGRADALLMAQWLLDHSF